VAISSTIQATDSETDAHCICDNQVINCQAAKWLSLLIAVLP